MPGRVRPRHGHRHGMAQRPRNKLTGAGELVPLRAETYGTPAQRTAITSSKGIPAASARRCAERCSPARRIASSRSSSASLWARPVMKPAIRCNAPAVEARAVSSSPGVKAVIWSVRLVRRRQRARRTEGRFPAPCLRGDSHARQYPMRTDLKRSYGQDRAREQRIRRPTLFAPHHCYFQYQDPPRARY